MIQAQLIVRDRVSADAISQAAARVGSTSEALAGVNLTVRSEAGGTATGGRSGANGFDSTSWGNGGYGPGHGHNDNARGGQGLDGQPAAAGNGPGHGAGGGSGSSADTSRGTTNSGSSTRLDAARPASSKQNRPLPGGSSLDIRA